MTAKAVITEFPVSLFSCLIRQKVFRPFWAAKAACTMSLMLNFMGLNVRLNGYGVFYTIKYRYFAFLTQVRLWTKWELGNWEIRFRFVIY